MATFYADLDLTGTGGDGLTESTPWHANDFQEKVYLGIEPGDILKVKGEHDYGNIFPDNIINVQGYGSPSGPTGPITVENWIAEPFRIKCARFWIGSNSIVKNGIIEAYGSNGRIEIGGKTYNCFLKALYITNSNGTGLEPMDVNGCTLIAPEIWGSSYNCGGEIGSFKDSILSGVINTSVPNSFDAISTDNCVFTDAVIPGIGAHTDAQTGWTPPTWPAWDAAQSAFSSVPLSAGINTPPEPGNPPYSNYEQGLWGSTRTGIGAMDFAGGPVTTTTAEPSTTTSTTLPPDPLDPLAFNKRKSHGPVIIDGGPGGRSVSGNGHEMSDYHAPWWLQ